MKKLLEDNELPILQKLLNEGQVNPNNENTFWITKPRSCLYRMIIKGTGECTEADFPTRLLCIIDDKSVRINDLYKNARHKYELTLFAETISKPSYSFKIESKDYTTMYIGSSFGNPTWRLKKTDAVPDSRVLGGYRAFHNPLTNRVSQANRVSQELIYQETAMSEAIVGALNSIYF